VIQNLLKFGGGFGTLLLIQIGFTAHLDWIESAKETLDLAARCAQVIGSRHPQ